MALQHYDSGTITCVTTTHALITDHIKGKILKIQIIASASSDFKIWEDTSDTRGVSCVDEYILGDASNTVTVNTTVTYYPAIEKFNTDQATPATFDPDQYTEFIIDSRLQVDASNVAADDTFRVIIWYDDMSGRTNP